MSDVFMSLFKFSECRESLPSGNQAVYRPPRVCLFTSVIVFVMLLRFVRSFHYPLSFNLIYALCLFLKVSVFSFSFYSILLSSHFVIAVDVSDHFSVLCFVLLSV